MRTFIRTLLSVAVLASVVNVVAETAGDAPAVTVASTSRIQVSTGTSLQPDTGWD
ncbi:hypothetical protein AB0469_38050 [Streptomyces sp. NPDC093801]|uniref:hypothetical protein n=1 Tax=Streptomyces sp. NPDC093801 TaxID=3155203 RepID=UPI003450E719